MKSSLFCTINPIKPKPTSYVTQIQILFSSMCPFIKTNILHKLSNIEKP